MTNFCTAFICTPKTGEMSQLKKYRLATIAQEGSSHAHSDKPPSSPKNANNTVGKQLRLDNLTH